MEGSDVSWLIDRKIDLEHEPDYWLRKDILSIEPSEVTVVTIMLQDGDRLELTNNGDEENTFEVTNLTDPTTQVVEAELHQVTNALSSFQLLDVDVNTNFANVEPTMKVTFQLKSGVIVTVIAYEVENNHYAELELRLVDDVSAEQKPAAEKYKDELKKLTSRCVYKIPNVTYDSMNKREADVLAITEYHLN